MSLRLNLGCGPLRYEGEIGVDRYPTPAADVVCDILTLPYPDGAAEFVRMDHILEHMPGRMAPTALLEAYRVLQPGGKIRVGVPDMQGMAETYAKATRLADKVLLTRWLYGSQAHEGEYHRSCWDAQTLADLLGACGFVDVTVAPDPTRDEGICIVATGKKGEG